MQTSLKYATFPQRFSALILDFFIIVLPSFWLTLKIIVPFIMDIDQINAAADKEFEFLYLAYKNIFYISLALNSVAAAIMAGFTISKWQATPGKKIVGLLVAKNDGSRLKFLSAFGRYISLPLFIMMLQIFSRNEIYMKLEAIHASATKDLSALQSGFITEITSLIVIAVISIWYLRIIFSKNKTAIHDVLFDTRVLQTKI